MDQPGKVANPARGQLNREKIFPCPRGCLRICTHTYAPPRRQGCVCVCVFSSHSFWTSSSLDVPAGVTQEEGHTGFLIHLLSAARALTFLARRIQPLLSLVDREVEFLCTNDLIVLHPLSILFFVFLLFSEKNPVCRHRTHVPTCQRVTRYL